MKIVYETDFKAALNILMAVRETSFELLTLLWNDEQSCPLFPLTGFVMILPVALPPVLVFSALWHSGCVYSVICVSGSWVWPKRCMQ